MLEMPPFCHGSKVRELSKTWKTKEARQKTFATWWSRPYGINSIRINTKNPRVVLYILTSKPDSCMYYALA